MFGAILGLIIPVSLIAALVRAVQSRSDVDAPTVSLRRFFHYVVLLGLAIVSAMGLAGLLAQVLPEGDELVRLGSTAEAQAISFTIVGLPLYVAMAFWTRRRLGANPAEAASLGWAFYLSVVQLIGVAVVMTIGVRTLNWALADGGLDTTDAAHGLVWLVAWGAHWAIAGRTIDPRRMVPHVLAASAASLGVLVAGATSALGAALNALYSKAFQTVLVEDLEGLLRESAGLVIVGGITWWWYWVRTGTRSEQTTLWNAYVLLIGVLGGLVTALAGAGALIAAALDWGFAGGAAVDKLDVAPEAATAILIGAAVWAYHRGLIGAGRSEVRRSYEYLVSALGLVAVAVAISTAVFALLHAATETSDTIASNAGRNATVAAITLAVLGLPLWWIAWSHLRRETGRDPASELRSTARRVYLFALIGAGAIAAIVALIVLVFAFVRDFLDGNLGKASVRDAAGAVGVFFASLAVTGYHWTVYQQDRAAVPEEDKPRLREVIYVGADGRAIVEAITAATGARVHVWAREDVVEGHVRPLDVALAVKQMDRERVLVIQRDGGTFEILPVRR